MVFFLLYERVYCVQVNRMFVSVHIPTNIAWNIAMYSRREGNTWFDRNHSQSRYIVWKRCKSNFSLLNALYFL